MCSRIPSAYTSQVDTPAALTTAVKEIDAPVASSASSAAGARRPLSSLSLVRAAFSAAAPTWLAAVVFIRFLWPRRRRG